MKHELEMKFRLLNKSTFIKNLKDRGITFSCPIEQEDIVFFRKNKGYADLSNGEPVIRIRKQAGSISTTLKKNNHGFTDRLEVECKISDADVFQNYLELLDIYPLITVKKQRQVAQYKDATISIDHIPTLGTFVEIEIISNNEDTSLGLKMLSQIAIELGLDINLRITTPYDQMLYERLH